MQKLNKFDWLAHNGSLTRGIVQRPGPLRLTPKFKLTATDKKWILFVAGIACLIIMLHLFRWYSATYALRIGG